LQVAKDISETPVVVLVTQRPAGNILDAVVECFHYEVRTTGKKGETSYTLVRPQSDREREQRLREADLKTFKDRMAIWAEFAGEDRHNLAEFSRKHPKFFLRAEATITDGGGPLANKAGHILTLLSKDQLEAVYRGEKLSVPFSSLFQPGKAFQEFKAMLLAAVQRHTEDFTPGTAQQAAYPLPEEILNPARVLVWMDADSPGFERTMHVRVTNIDLQPALDAQFLKSWPTRYYRQDIYFGGTGPSSGGFSAPFELVKDWKKKRLQLKDAFDPPFDTKAEKMEDNLSDEERSHPVAVYKELHRLTGAPIVADYHIHVKGLFLQPLGATLGDAIDFIIPAFDVTWLPVHGIHTFRSNTWFDDDRLNVPLRLVQGWEDQAKKEKRYSADLLAEIVQLTDSQLGHLEGYGFLEGIYPALVVPDVRAALRLWGSLTEEQKNAALAQGLPFSALSNDQGDQLVEDADRIPTQPKTILKAEVQGKGQIALNFISSQTDPVVTITLAPVTYIPLKKERPDGKWFSKLEEPAKD
jgi:hypothetical protein